MRQLHLPLREDEAVVAVFSTWSEDTLQTYVMRLARMCGWRVYHTRFSIKSVAGFPDLVLVKGTRLIFAELKREGLWPTEGHMGRGAVPRWVEGQREWLLALAETTAEVYLWWPSDSQDIATILTEQADASMACVIRTREYLRDADHEAPLPHGAAAPSAVAAGRRTGGGARATRVAVDREAAARQTQGLPRPRRRAEPKARR